MHESQFALAALPEPPRIYRVQLRPYTLGHELHLWRSANPYRTRTFEEFEKLPGNIQHIATLQAVNICSNDFAANCRRPNPLWRLWNFIASFYNLSAATAQFWHYLDLGHSRFKAELPEGADVGAPRLLGAPYVARLYQHVCDNVPDREIRRHSPGKHPTAWDYPMALAILLEQVRSEDRGNLSIHHWGDAIVDQRLSDLAAA